MTTVAAMFKRILTLAGGALLGMVLATVAVRMAATWTLWPNRELARSTAHLREVMRLVNEHYVEEQPVAYEQLARRALHGMVEGLDPHSAFLERKTHQEFEEDIAGQFGGVGIQVETRQGRIVVITPLAGTPGERAGIQRGDEIISIDGRPVESGAGLDGIVSRLRGRPGTTVVLGLQRPSTGATLNLPLVREIIRIESVRGVRVLEEGPGYVQLTEFSEHTSAQFRVAVERLRQQGVNGLIIDLRNNPGGLLEGAVGVAEPFFRRGELIVSTRGRKPEDREDYRAVASGDPIRLPLAILINAGSASAAEIVAGALKDAGRAVIVGERSFGKGSVQSVFKLPGGEGLRLTTARYFTPGGYTIHERGITPHVEVVMSPEEDTKLARQRARFDIVDPSEFKSRFGFDPIPDRQLETAIAMLRGVELLTVAGAAEAAR